MDNLRSKFGSYLDDHIETVTAILRREGLEKNEQGVPDLGRIRPQLGPQEVPLPDGLQFVLSAARSVGTAWEWKGELSKALAWYSLGALSWRGGRQFKHHMDEDPPDISARSAAGRNQLNTAVCADRVGDQERAQRLYEWASYNRSFNSQEIKFYEENQAQILWEFLPYKAYALICQDKWEDGLAVAEQVSAYIEKDKRAKGKESYRSSIKVHEVVLNLSRSMLNPTEESRRIAIQSLDPQTVASRSHGAHRDALFYLYNLRARHPDLANPKPEELSPGERCRQGYEACVKWLARVGLELDGTPESLELLDDKAGDIGPVLDNEVDEKAFLFLFGSYLGEVIRRELAGGQWIFEGSNMLDWKLDWKMGEAGFHILPFREVARSAQGEETFALYDVWQEAEKTYTNLGLAARYAD